MTARLSRGDATHALIIGINDYGGAADLQGGVPDARAWVHIALEMGIPGDNITVLSRPVLDASPWSGQAEAANITFADATHDAIVRAAGELAGVLATPAGGKAMVTFSGHGSWDTEKCAMLVPADGADDTGKRIALEALLDVFSTRAKRTDVTLFVDACHAARGGAEPRARARTLVGDAVPPDARPCRMRRGGDILLTATQPQSLSHEIEVGGEHRGAFSWAITSLLDRWGVRSPGKDPDFDISYRDLLDRANQLLTAMEVIQPPQYQGPEWALGRAVLGSRLADEPGGVPEEDGVREVDPSTGWYQIETSAGDFAGGMTASSTELEWTWDLDKVSGPFPSGLSLTLTKQSGTFTPPSNKLVQTFDNHYGLKSTSTTLTPTYKVTASGTSDVYYVLYSTSNGLEWIANTANNLSGNTIQFDEWSGGSLTRSHYRQDDFV